MKILIIRILNFATVVFLVVVTHKVNSAESENRVFRAGAATSNITPFLGSPVAGAESMVPTNNVHDELHARVLVLDDGKIRLVLVVCEPV